MREQTYSRAEIERACGVTADDLDNWLRRGLLMLAPATRRGRKREFTRASAIEITLVVAARDRGFLIDFFVKAAIRRAELSLTTPPAFFEGEALVAAIRKLPEFSPDHASNEYWWSIQAPRESSLPVEHVELLRSSDSVPLRESYGSSPMPVTVLLNISAVVKATDGGLAQVETERESPAV